MSQYVRCVHFDQVIFILIFIFNFSHLRIIFSISLGYFLINEIINVEMFY